MAVPIDGPVLIGSDKIEASFKKGVPTLKLPKKT
jgi:hypothetical protein